ncbi:MAG TPA: hypothetical protein ENJ79_09810 [Gammaproteobacteria bacterium]|nr:hypothetical protein [Gammaproteobacteria bacterium]
MTTSETGHPTTALGSRNRIQDILARFSANFLILWTPFFFFSSFRGHPLPPTALAWSIVPFTPAALALTVAAGPNKGIRRVAVFTLAVCLFLDLHAPWFENSTAIITAALIAILFWLIKEHLALIIAVMFGTMLVMSAFNLPGKQYNNWTPRKVNETTPQTATSPDNILIHLVLDEFAGPDSIPQEIPGGAELKAELANFFRRNDFTLYPHAISEYASTKASISGILNYDAGKKPWKYYRGRHPYILNRNPHFNSLYRHGYKIRVYQSTYMDYCTNSPVPLDSCFTYRFDATDWLQSSPLDDIQKMNVLLGMYLNLDGFFEAAWKSYTRIFRYAREHGLPLPQIMAWDGTVAPAATVDMIEYLRRSVAQAPAGTALFGHLLLPHGPYIFDKDCNIQGHPLDWVSSHPLHEKANTRAGRRKRYTLYFAQVACTLNQLQSIFDTLKESGKWHKTEIILHGDHGARIFATAPRKQNLKRLGTRDLADGFSTLFAVKSRRWKPPSDNRVRSVSWLLADLDGAGNQPASEYEPPVIFLEGEGDEMPWTPMRWQGTTR